MHATGRKARDRSGPAAAQSLIFTTEFSWKRRHPEAVGSTTKVGGSKDMLGRKRRYTLCGLLMHSSMAVTTDGLPLGMAAVKFWTRKKFKDKAALKRKVNSTRVPIEGKESMRWLETLRHSTELLGAPGPGRQAGLSHLSFSPSSGSGLLRLR